MSAKIVSKNHQERKFEKNKKPIPKETPVADFFRKVIFYGTVAAVLFAAYQFVFIRLRTERTVKDITEIIQAVRGLTKQGRSYEGVATAENLFYNGQIGSDVYNENSKLISNRFGGLIIVAPYMGGTMFTVEVSGIPANVCKKLLSKNWSVVTTNVTGLSAYLDSLRIGTKVYNAGTGFIPSQEDLNIYCESKNIKFTYR